MHGYSNLIAEKLPIVSRYMHFKFTYQLWFLPVILAYIIRRNIEWRMCAGIGMRAGDYYNSAYAQLTVVFGTRQ